MSTSTCTTVTESRTRRVVAIVLNWNAWADTILCVESVLTSDCVPHQVVICDNGSLDGSMERLTEWAQSRGDCSIFDTPAAAVAHGPASESLVLIRVGANLGYAGGNNIGIRYALEQSDADFVWILNSDVIVADDALTAMLVVAQSDATTAMVGSKLLRRHEPDTIQALGGGFIIPLLCHDTQLGAGQKETTAGTEPIKLDHIVGASLLVRAAAIRRVGLIDESYFLYREETDWCIRMRLDGWYLYCCTRASVWHKQSHSIGFKSPLHDYYAVRNMLHLVRKFYPTSLPAAFGYFACRAFLPKLARFEFARLAAVGSAFFDFLRGVTGRSLQHSDRAFVNNYQPGRTSVPAHGISKRVPVVPAVAVGAMVLAALAAGVGVAFNHQPPHRSQVAPNALSVSAINNQRQ